ncbi:MAG: RluA family pseudouridine synthase [bacterium]|nr:RluA family pseudouridine synthase [bacterium]
MKTLETPHGAIKILHEDDDLLIIDKPSGLVVHEGDTTTEPTLADYLLAAYPKIAGVGEDELRPGIVHRLDREASGLMVIARNNKAFEHLKKQFKKRTIKKEYIALVFGKVIKDEGKILFPIVRSRAGFKMAALPMSADKIEESKKGRLSNRDKGVIEAYEKSREAITEFEVTKKWNHLSLLSVKIKTGRTHQIRVHFAAYGHPLVGDDIYGTPKTKARNKKINLGRIFLHAHKLSFTGLNKEKKEFVSDLPDNLSGYLNKQK